VAIDIHSPQIESTYKDKDLEEFIDIYFFRPFGYLLARAAKSIKLKPNAVTVIGMILGVISGHLFYYSSMTINTRQFTLFVLLFFKIPEGFFFFELIILNIVLLYGAALRESKFKHLIAMAESYGDNTYNGKG
jgi:hypothetical protein